MDLSSSLFDFEFGAEFEYFDRILLHPLVLAALSLMLPLLILKGWSPPSLTTSLLIIGPMRMDVAVEKDASAVPINHTALRAFLFRHGIGILLVRGLREISLMSSRRLIDMDIFAIIFVCLYLRLRSSPTS
jgi:hypothetical protein